jgi:hypothetical protein
MVILRNEELCFVSVDGIAVEGAWVEEMFVLRRPGD